MICDRCKTKTRVVNSRRTEDKLSVRRKRICYNCGYEFITYESKVSHKQDKTMRGDIRDWKRSLFKIGNSLWQSLEDREVAHLKADDVLFQFLKSLGYTNVVEIKEDMKWKM